MTARRAIISSLKICVMLVAARQWATVSAEEAIPSAFAADRYAPLRASSPFALTTAAAPVPTPQVSFAINWYVSGIARIGDHEFVAIKSRDLSQQFSLFAGESVDGVTLAGVRWSDEVGKSTVTLRCGTETAQLEFNEAQVHGPAVAAGPAPAGQATPSGIAGRSTLANAAGSNPRPMGVNVAAMNPGGPAAGLDGGTGQGHRNLPVITPR